MCYTDDARVPLPPVGGGASNSSDLVLTAADGNRLMAHAARATRPGGRGIVVMPDVRGLHNFYRELAQRFAEGGIDAVAIDYFGRTAGEGDRGEGFDWKPHVDQITARGMTADVAAGAAHLRSSEGGGVASVFTVGFCFGGSSSWNQSASGIDLQGCIGFYGQPARSEAFVDRMRAPLLLLIAGADFLPQAVFEAFDRRLSEAGVEHEMKVYPGAPHSFFDRSFAEHAEACADAWSRMLAFIERHSHQDG